MIQDLITQKCLSKSNIETVILSSILDSTRVHEYELYNHETFATGNSMISTLISSGKPINDAYIHAIMNYRKNDDTTSLFNDDVLSRIKKTF